MLHSYHAGFTKGIHHWICATEPRDREGVHAEEVAERPASEIEPLHPRASRTSRAEAAKKADVPDCTTDEAVQLGRQARRDDQPVISNPFPWDDKRRRFWDEGWRNEDGGDGMGPAQWRLAGPQLDSQISVT